MVTADMNPNIKGIDIQLLSCRHGEIAWTLYRHIKYSRLAIKRLQCILWNVHIVLTWKTMGKFIAMLQKIWSYSHGQNQSRQKNCMHFSRHSVFPNSNVRRIGPQLLQVLGYRLDYPLQWRHGGARWRLKSPASSLFAQPFIQAQIKENIKAPRHLPLCGEFTGDRWIPRTNGQ